MHELVEMEVRELLSNYDYDGDNTPIIKGSALCGLNGTDPELGEKALEQLVNEMDAYIPLPERPKDKSFTMSIDQALNIAGRGTVVTGTVEQGTIKPGEEVHLVGIKRKPISTTITSIEAFKKTLDNATAGDNCGLLLRGVTKDEIKRGMVIAKPNTLEVRRNFESELYVLKEDEGGRHKPFFTGYRPQCFIRTADVACDLSLPKDKQMAVPGDHFTATMKLTFPLPLLPGQRFALREGGKTVASGVVSKMLEDTAEDFEEEERRAAIKKGK